MMEKEKFEALKRFIPSLIGKWSVKNLVAEVHNLYQDYLINEEQEDELYKLVDPEDKEDSPAELWFNDYGCAELWDFVERGGI